MRIGQLARRIGISPSDIMGFLGTQNIETEAGANSRLDDGAVRKVVKRFAPEKLSEIFEVPAVQETPVVAPQPDFVQETEGVAEEAPVTAIDDEEKTAEETSAEVEVIRVSKVELQGLKVLGKIELPQPKKKETAADQPTGEEEVQPQQEAETQPQQPQRPRREFQKRTDRRDQREWKNPLETKRQQEARETERKKQENLERQKEKRTNHYYNKVKSVPTKAARRLEEQTVVEDIDVKEPPKGLLGRFFRWLTT